MFDILNALDTLATRQESATIESLALELGTTREDVAPQLMQAVRSDYASTAKRSDGISTFELTRQGAMALHEEGSSSTE
jgi:hypothetical protein